MENRIVTAVFKYSAYTKSDNIWQWDYGQILRIQGLKLPTAVEVHFAVSGASESITRIGTTKDGVTDVVIPDSLIETGKNLVAYVYLRDSESGSTEYRIDMVMSKRAKPEAYNTPEDKELFGQAIEAVNKAADRAEKAGQVATEAAAQAAEDAQKTAEDRKEVEKMVETVTDISEQVKKVEELSNKAQESVTQAETSATAAEKAKEQAETAKAGAETAAGKTAEDRTSVNQAKTAVEEAQRAVRADRTAVEEAKQSVEQLGNAIPEATKAGVQAVNQAKQTAVDEIVQTGTAHKTAVEGAGTKAVQDVENVKQTATEAVETVKTEATQAVQTEGTKQTGNVTAEGQKQLTFVQQAAQEIAADREQIKTNKADIADLRQTKAGAIIVTVSGDKIQVEDSAVAGFDGMRIFGKSTQDGTPAPHAPVMIKNAGSKGNIVFTIKEDTNNQSITLQTPNGLPGLQVDSGGNYTDSNGQQWICDEMDFKRGKYVQRVGKRVLDGSDDENWSEFTGANLTKTKRFSSARNSIPAVDKSLVDSCITNRFLYLRNDSDKEHFRLSVSNGIFNQVVLFTNVDTVNDVNALKNWLKLNPVEILVPLATPIETNIPEESMTAYRKLCTNYPSTVVQNDAGAGMEVEYMADTKSYIDNKLKELAQAAYGSMANMLSLMPTNVQAAMIENDINNIL